MVTGLGAELLFRVHRFTNVLNAPASEPPPESPTPEDQKPGNKPSGPPALEPGEVVVRSEDLACISKYCFRGGWVMHILGWFCAIVPWIVIMQRYLQWFDMDGPSTACLQDYADNWAGALPGKVPASTPRPVEDGGKGDFAKVPDFVKGIVWTQLVFFLVFGIVQTVQFCRKNGGADTEITYIFLSATAKIVLGMLVGAGLLF